MSYCESAFPFRFFDTKKAVNCLKREKVFISQSFYIFPIILYNMGKRLSFICNLIPAFKWNLELSIFFNFFFLGRTSDNFRLLRNLPMVRSLLILWQFSRSSEPQGTSISFKMLQTVDWRFFSSIEVVMPKTSIHRLLLYCSWACRILSSDVIQFKDNRLQIW